MKIDSLYISAKELNVGSLFVSMGMMEILKQRLPRVAFFRPIVANRAIHDSDILFMLEHYQLDMEYEEAYGVDVAYVESMVAQNRVEILIGELLQKFKSLEREYDFILCEGIQLSFLSSLNFNLNLKLAQNFGASYINVISAKNQEEREIYENICIESKEIQTQGCSHFATFVNRAHEEIIKRIESRFQESQEKIFYLKEVEELSLLTLQDVVDSFEIKPLFMEKDDHTRTIRAIKVAALSLDNFLAKIEEDDLIIVPADRSEIIVGLFVSLHSKNCANISAIVFPFAMDMHPNIQKLIEGLSGFGIPILSVSGDTYETAKKMMSIHSRIRPNATRKIALAMGLFRESVDSDFVLERIKTQKSDVMTPLMFEYKLFEMAGANLKRVVLPEAQDERILRAVEIVLHRKVADIILLGDKQEIEENYLRLGLDLSKATIINPCTSPLMEEFVEHFYEMRRSKGLSRSASEDAMTHFTYFATMMVELGYADAMVSGAIHSTADTIRPALQIIKTKPDYEIVSSIFFMCLDTKVLVYGDCAIVQEPNSKQLAQIAIASARSAEMFGITPRVAMLSYATGESGKGSDVDKVREATEIVKEKERDILVEGPIQYDAAIDADVAKIKLPNSKVAGRATVFIFPDLNTGNNTYKAVQRSSGAIAIGPILQGLRKPVNDLSRGCLVEDIVNTIAITAIQAGEEV